MYLKGLFFIYDYFDIKTLFTSSYYNAYKHIHRLMRLFVIIFFNAYTLKLFLHKLDKAEAFLFTRNYGTICIGTDLHWTNHIRLHL
jgi:hypothetical protein